MKSIFIVFLVLLAGYFGYKNFISHKGQFSFAKVEEQPIPKLVFFEMWKDVALEQCANAKEQNNLTPGQCREKVAERHDSCERSTAEVAPEMIGDRATSRQLAKNYLSCVTPHFFCNGIEVRSEEEALRHCQ